MIVVCVVGGSELEYFLVVDEAVYLAVDDVDCGLAVVTEWLLSMEVVAVEVALEKCGCCNQLSNRRVVKIWFKCWCGVFNNRFLRVNIGVGCRKALVV